MPDPDKVTMFDVFILDSVAMRDLPKSKESLASVILEAYETWSGAARRSAVGCFSCGREIDEPGIAAGAVAGFVFAICADTGAMCFAAYCRDCAAKGQSALGDQFKGQVSKDLGAHEVTLQ